MKLIYCPVCNDMRGLNTRDAKGGFIFCSCKSSWAKRQDNVNIELGGAGILIHIYNSTFENAVQGCPYKGQDSRQLFMSRILPVNSDCIIEMPNTDDFEFYLENEMKST